MGRHLQGSLRPAHDPQGDRLARSPGDDGRGHVRGRGHPLPVDGDHQVALAHVQVFRAARIGRHRQTTRRVRRSRLPPGGVERVRGVGDAPADPQIAGRAAALAVLPLLTQLPVDHVRDQLVHLLHGGGGTAQVALGQAQGGGEAQGIGDVGRLVEHAVAEGGVVEGERDGAQGPGDGPGAERAPCARPGAGGRFGAAPAAAGAAPNAARWVCRACRFSRAVAAKRANARAVPAWACTSPCRRSRRAPICPSSAAIAATPPVSRPPSAPPLIALASVEPSAPFAPFAPQNSP